MIGTGKTPIKTQVPYKKMVYQMALRPQNFANCTERDEERYLIGKLVRFAQFNQDIANA
jgi:hypothetical protein